MSESNHAFKNIIVVIDPAEGKHYALERAIMMNTVFDGGVNIHLSISIEMDKLRKDHDTFAPPSSAEAATSTFLTTTVRACGNTCGCPWDCQWS